MNSLQEFLNVHLYVFCALNDTLFSWVLQFPSVDSSSKCNSTSSSPARRYMEEAMEKMENKERSHFPTIRLRWSLWIYPRNLLHLDLASKQIPFGKDGPEKQCEGLDAHANWQRFESTLTAFWMRFAVSLIANYLCSDCEMKAICNGCCWSRICSGRGTFSV